MKSLLTVAVVAALACASGTTASDSAASGDPSGDPSSGGASAADGELRVGEPFRLATGERMRLAGEDLTVRFVAVTGDSRCPTDVTCFWAGDAEVEARLTRGEEEATVSVHTHGGAKHPREASALGCTLRLEDLEPYPSSKRKIAPEDYVATLILKLEQPEE